MSSQTSETPTIKTQVPEDSDNKTFHFSATLKSVWLTDAQTLDAHRYFHCTSERSLSLPVVHRCVRRLTWYSRRVVQELRATFCCMGISDVPFWDCCSGHYAASRGWWYCVFASVAWHKDLWQSKSPFHLQWASAFHSERRKQILRHFSCVKIPPVCFVLNSSGTCVKTFSVSGSSVFLKNKQLFWYYLCVHINIHKAENQMYHCSRMLILTFLLINISNM